MGKPDTTTTTTSTTSTTTYTSTTPTSTTSTTKCSLCAVDHSAFPGVTSLAVGKSLSDKNNCFKLTCKSDCSLKEEETPKPPTPPCNTKGDKPSYLNEVP